VGIVPTLDGLADLLPSLTITITPSPHHPINPPKRNNNKTSTRGRTDQPEQTFLFHHETISQDLSAIRSCCRSDLFIDRPQAVAAIPQYYDRSETPRADPGRT